MTKALVAASVTFNRAERSTPEEALPAAFQPDTLLPVQYYTALRRKQFLEGEKLLMFVILQQSVEDYMKYLNSPKRKGQRRFREAEEWINGRDKLWLFSFDNVCDALDIDSEYMRRGLYEWKQTHVQRTEPTAQLRG